MSVEFNSEIERFCLKKAYETPTFVYDLSAHRFANPSFEDSVVNALEDYYASRCRWEPSND